MTDEIKDYFKPVFSDADIKEDTPIKQFPSADQMVGLFRVISQEFEDYQGGKSQFSKQAVIFDQRTGPSPLFNGFAMVKNNPNEKTWKAFLEIVAQEMNTRVSDYFNDQLNLLKEQHDEQKTHLK